MNKPKQQGTAHETWTVNWLNGLSGVHGAGRVAEGGQRDIGDVAFEDALHTTWVVECKATQTLNVTRALDKARRKSKLGRTTILVWKRLVKSEGKQRRAPDGQPIVVVMGIDTFETLINNQQ